MKRLIRWCYTCESFASARESRNNGGDASWLRNRDFMKRKMIADVVIFSGMLINAVVIVLILYFYVI